MSTCPTKDIHSLYLDNEIPEIYKTEYESHLQNCPKCRAELEKLKSLRVLLHSDSDSEMSSAALDESFARLQLKMKYSKNTGRHEKKGSTFNYSIPFAISAAAAAAVFALIIPIRNNSKINNSAVSETAIASSIINNSSSASNVSFGSGRNTPISGNMHRSVISSAKNGRNGFIQNVSDNSVAQNLIQDVDIFRPKFAGRNANSIKITVPDMNTMPVTVEIQFPDAVGQVFTSEFDQ